MRLLIPVVFSELLKKIKVLPKFSSNDNFKNNIKKKELLWLPMV